MTMKSLMAQFGYADWESGTVTFKPGDAVTYKRGSLIKPDLIVEAVDANGMLQFAGFFGIYRADDYVLATAYEDRVSEPPVDMVNQPPHYLFDDGVEVIDLTEQLNFNSGNAVKYVARAGRKDPAKAIEDLEKAEFYVKKELARVRRRTDGS